MISYYIKIITIFYIFYKLYYSKQKVSDVLYNKIYLYLYNLFFKTGDNLNINFIIESKTLPKNFERIEKNRSIPNTYYMNVYTLSYSAVWWDWS